MAAGFLGLPVSLQAFAERPQSLGDPLNPTVPRGVPQSGDPYIKRRNDVEGALMRGASEKGGSDKGAFDKRKRRPRVNRFEDRAAEGVYTELGDGSVDPNALITIGKIEIPNLGGMKSGASLKNGRFEMGRAQSLPVLVSTPPRRFGGYLGTTLALSADAVVPESRGEDVYFVWIVNSRVVCTGKQCLLPLDGSTLDVGAQVLSIVAYHSGGSTHSDHLVQVTQGNWRKGDVFNRKVVRTLAPVSVPTAASAAPDASRDVIYALSGQGVHAYPAYFRLLGDIGQNIRWLGRLRTNASGVLRLMAPKGDEWYLLKKSTVRLVKPKSEQHREMELEQGGLRLRASRRADAEAGSEAILDDRSVETPELRIDAREGADFFVVRNVPPSPKTPGESPAPVPSVSVITISGTVRVTLKKVFEGQPAVYNLPPGIEFTAHADGRTDPLQKPDGDRMAKLQAITITPSEVAAAIAAQNIERAKGMDLQALLKDAEASLAAEDYFEILSLLSPVLSRARENVRVSYLMGLANKGLYQATEAETYLKTAHEQDEGFDGPAWHLALLKMEQKKWAEAQSWIDAARDSMDRDDPRQAEADYYEGVASFQLGNDFASRTAFTRALWDKTLESSLQGSAASFLRVLIERKGWGLVTPFGVQYDANVLSLTSDEPVPEGFSERGSARSIAGLIFSVDPASQAKKPGTYWGYGGKALAISNYPRSFASLDVILADLSMSQSFVDITSQPPAAGAPPGTAPTEKKSVVKFSQGLGLVMLDMKPTIGSVQLGLDLPLFDLDSALSLVHETDLQDSLFGTGDATTLGESITFPLAKWDSSQIEMPLSLKQKFTFRRDAVTGPGLTTGLLPTYTTSLTPRLSFNSSVKLEHEIKLTDASPINTFTSGVTAGLMYFLTPWCLVLPSAGYDVISASDKEALVHKPLASLLFTALF